MTHIFFLSSTYHGRDHYFQEAVDGLNVAVVTVRATTHEICFPNMTVWHFIVVDRKEKINTMRGYEIHATMYAPDWRPPSDVMYALHDFLRERLSRPLRPKYDTPLDTLPPA